MSRFQVGDLDPDNMDSEWDEIMASVNTSMEEGREDRIDEIQNSETNEDMFTSVEEWLSYLGLSEHELKFVINGFDNIKFLRDSPPDDHDLQMIGVTKSDHRRTILESLDMIDSWLSTATPCTTVEEWLNSLHLFQYLGDFVKNSYSTMSQVMKITSEIDLEWRLGISSLGHRKRIIASIKHLQQLATEDESDSLDLSKLEESIHEISVDETDSSNTTSLFKDYSQIVPTMVQPTEEEDRCEYLKIRPPMHLIISEETSTRKRGNPKRHCLPQYQLIAQWHHSPESLINDSCSYRVRYLGSQVIKYLKEPESSRKAIRRRRNDQHWSEFHVLLSISYNQVTLFDLDTKRFTLRYPVNRISFAVQDSVDLTYFAMVTEDNDRAGRHTCHVFNADDILATEVVLTLGEAFEINFQLNHSEKRQETTHGTTNLQSR
ncbi:ankyrin repeat and SAM domain-containing protein 1A-like isoform X2 [Tachypleus tridentatus]|uniref:ankyrin repeat and SAM domain-containing protein 1A-like isoform X2 n=1 Tax=Tachypleus tridentatus TaxID=6853 RepID=UPI003FD410F7